MRIGITGSFEFIDKIVETDLALKKLGHETYTSSFLKDFIGKTKEEVEKLKTDFEKDAFKDFWKIIDGGDAILVLNYEKRGIPNYIGGNTLIEMSYAYVHGQKIFLMNPIPQIQFYYDEIRAMKPVIINGNLEKIK